MSGQRMPKRKHPDKMCFQCREWEPCHADWGECSWMAESVPGDRYRLTYAYEDCWFGNMWKERKCN